MDISVRPIVEDEERTFFGSTERAFGHHLTDEDFEHERNVFERDRSVAAFDGPAIVGTAGAITMTVTVPCGEVPMTGVTLVGVLPTHRRRGVLTAMMQHQLEDVRDRGEPLAGLWASEGAIYGRFGYGVACFDGRIEAEKSRADFRGAPDDPGAVTLVPKERALEAMPVVYERSRPNRAGMLSRTSGYWAAQFEDLETWRDGASALFFVLHETAGVVDGYATYRLKSDWTEGMPGGAVLLRELIADTPQAYAGLWRYIFGIDLVTKIDAWGRPIDEPLLHLVTEPRRLKFRLTDALYLRIVDVPSALAGRRYAIEGRLVLGVRDGFGGWGEGRFELDGGPDGASCTPTTAEPDLSLSVRDLAAIYLGGISPRTLVDSGRVAEERPGAVSRAVAMFAADPVPWCPYVF